MASQETELKPEIRSKRGEAGDIGGLRALGCVVWGIQTLALDPKPKFRLEGSGA